MFHFSHLFSLGNNNPEKIIYGNNSSDSLSYLNNIDPSLLLRTHVFFIYLKDRYSRYCYGMSERKNFTFVHSISHNKDSSDLVITILSTRFDLDPNLKNVSFIYVSKDHFVKDLSDIFSKNRQCYTISSPNELSMIL